MNPLNAAAALMSRLTYAQKFLLLGLVLLAPAGFALKAYWGVQGDTLAFARSERAGVRFVAPANELAVRVVAARSVAVRAAAGESADVAGTVSAIQQAVAGVDAVDGAAIGTDPTWRQARATILSAATTKVAASPHAAYDRYAQAATAALAAVVKAGDGSKLILDPDLDSFYVMDALITKLPALADWTGRVADLQVIVGATRAMDDRVALASAQGALKSTQDAMTGGFATAFDETADPGLKPALAAPLQPFAGKPSLPAVAALAGAAAPRLDALLVARMHKYSAARNRVALIVVLGGLVALLLFVGFFRATRRGVGEISACVTSLREHESADLSAALDRMAQGDLTVAVTPLTPPLTAASRDELGRVATAVDEIRLSTIESIHGYNRMRSSLAEVIGTVAVNAGTVSAASQQMAASSDDTGRSVSEIATAVTDVAHGAERQVRVVETTRAAVQEAARVAGESAGTAHDTAAAAERRAA